MVLFLSKISFRTLTKKKTIFNQQPLAEILGTLCILWFNKKQIQVSCKMSFNTIDKYAISVILSMFYQLDRGRVQLTISVGNAWILHTFYIHTWLKIRKCIDSYLIVKVTGIGQKELRLIQNYVQTYWKLMFRRRYVRLLM